MGAFVYSRLQVSEVQLRKTKSSCKRNYFYSPRSALNTAGICGPSNSTK